MFQQELEKKSNETNAKKRTFEEIWEEDIDTLFLEYNLVSNVEEEDESFTDEAWMIF